MEPQDTTTAQDTTAQNRPQITPEQLREFVHYIVSNLVTLRDQVDVTVMEDMPGVYTVHVKVAAEDKGRVIGKSGNNINAIRTLVKVFGRIAVLVQD
jgi:predicted RNA-binding protein YlqC (UPF0109 family)